VPGWAGARRDEGFTDSTGGTGAGGGTTGGGGGAADGKGGGSPAGPVGVALQPASARAAPI
jgi:hypothetical protein